MTAPEPTAVERTIAETLARAYFEGLGWDRGTGAQRRSARPRRATSRLSWLVSGPHARVVGPWREVTGSATPARDLTPGARDV